MNGQNRGVTKWEEKTQAQFLVLFNSLATLRLSPAFISSTARLFRSQPYSVHPLPTQTWLQSPPPGGCPLPPLLAPQGSTAPVLALPHHSAPTWAESPCRLLRQPPACALGPFSECGQQVSFIQNSQAHVCPEGPSHALCRMVLHSHGLCAAG